MYLRFAKGGATAPAGPEDFIAACLEQGTCLGVWLPPDDVTGNINDGDTILEDKTETSARVVKAELASNGNWIWDTADTPTGGFTAAINTQDNRGQADFMGIDAALAATSSVIFIVKVATAQSAGQSIQFGGPTGGVAAPNVDESSFLVWADPDVYSYKKGAGTSDPITHSDYTDWVVCSFAGGQVNTGVSLSHVGGTFHDVGTDDAVNITGWTGFNAFSGSAADNHETGNGTVKYAGIAMFSGVLTAVEVQTILIAGGLITA